MRSARFFYKNNFAPTPNKPNHIGVAAVVEHDGKALLERRSDSGRWSLIGGGLKKDESISMCLSRELNEETGLLIRDATLLGIFSDPSRIVAYPDGNVLRIVTIGFVVQPQAFEVLTISCESMELQFFELEQLPSLDVVETHRHILDAYLSKTFILD